MSCTFATNFWTPDFCSTAGFDCLVQRLRDGKEMCRDFEEYMKKRAKIEKDYGESLIKLGREPLGKTEIGTLRESWERMKSETESSGQIHVEFSQKIQYEIQLKMKDFWEKQRFTRKKSEEAVKTVAQHKKTSFNKSNVSKLTYNNRCNEADKAEENHKKLRLNPHTKTKDLTQADKKKKATRQAVTTTDSAYRESVQVLEKARAQWEKEMESLCELFQELEEQRIKYLRQQTFAFCNLCSQVSMQVDKSCDNVRNSLEKCDVAADIDLFVKEKATGSQRPKPILYVNFYQSTDSHDGETLSDSSKELPPLQLPLPKEYEDSAFYSSILETEDSSQLMEDTLSVVKNTEEMMSPKNVRVTLHVQSEVEIKSILKKADLCEIARKKFCFKEEDIILEQFDEKSKKWEELTSKEANGKLMLEEGMELKLKKRIQDYVDIDIRTEDDQTEICLVAKKSSLQVDMHDDLEWDNVGTWLPDNRLWKGEGELVEYLRIYFFEDTEHVLDRFKYRFQPLTPGVIMEIINEVWNMDGVENGQCVPKFKHVDNNKVEVRVQFHSSDGSWSMLGSAAQGGSLNNPTVVLNFNHCMDDFDIRATIAHQFGHVLGLGHMHQEPKYWHVISRFIDLEKMLNDLNISKKQFDTQWANMEYYDENFVHDEHSVMHYQTKLSWLNDQIYRGKANLRDLTERKEITMEEYKELRRFHKQTKLFCCEPSNFDKLKLAEAYYNVSKKIPSRSNQD